MICDYCGRDGARTRYIPRTYGRGNNLLVIENVPVVSCPHCGESYSSAETLHQIDQIKRNRKVFTIARPVKSLSSTEQSCFSNLIHEAIVPVQSAIVRVKRSVALLHGAIVRVKRSEFRVERSKFRDESRIFRDQKSKFRDQRSKF